MPSIQDLITRVLQATPEEQELVGRILAEASVNPRPPRTESTAGGQTTDIEPFIKQPVLAERMHVSRRTISNMIEAGLPHYKLGRSLLFRWSEIQAHLAATCRVPRRVDK